MPQGFVPLMVLIAAVTAGCTPVATAPTPTVYVPDNRPSPGKALLVVIHMGGRNFSNSVYRVTDGGETFIGIVTGGQKAIHEVDPGDHLFMVIGGASTAFMAAHMDPGKTYYARTGQGAKVWGAPWTPHSALFPCPKDPEDNFSSTSAEFIPWTRNFRLVTPSESDFQWYASHRAFVDERRRVNLEKWKALPEDTRKHFTLNRDDGL